MLNANFWKWQQLGSFHLCPCAQRSFSNDKWSHGNDQSGHIILSCDDRFYDCPSWTHQSIKQISKHDHLRRKWVWLHFKQNARGKSFKKVQRFKRSKRLQIHWNTKPGSDGVCGLRARLFQPQSLDQGLEFLLLLFLASAVVYLLVLMVRTCVSLRTRLSAVETNDSEQGYTRRQFEPLLHCNNQSYVSRNELRVVKQGVRWTYWCRAFVILGFWSFCGSTPETSVTKRKCTCDECCVGVLLSISESNVPNRVSCCSWPSHHKSFGDALCKDKGTGNR